MFLQNKFNKVALSVTSWLHIQIHYPMRTNTNSSVIIPLPQIESIQPVNKGKYFIIRCISKKGSLYDWKFDNSADRDASFSILESLLGFDFKVKKLKAVKNQAQR